MKKLILSFLLVTGFIYLQAQTQPAKPKVRYDTVIVKHVYGPAAKPVKNP